MTSSSNSYAWLFTTQNAPINFPANVATVVPRANWYNVSCSDPVLSSTLNNAIMNNQGVIRLPKSGTFNAHIVLDPTELQYTGTATASMAQSTTNAANGQVTTFALGTLTLPSGSNSPVAFAQTIYCTIGDILTLTLNFGSAFTPSNAIRCVNTSLNLTDLSNDTRPIFMAGSAIGPVLPGNGVLAPRFYVATQTLTTSNGKITFILTTNGSAPASNTNNLLFPNGIGVITFAAKPSGSLLNPIYSPMANEDSRASDNSTVTANVVIGNISTVVLGGTTSGLQAAPVGTIVQCFVLGW